MWHTCEVWGCRDGKACRGSRRLGKIHEGGLQTPLGCGSSCDPPTERLMWRKNREEAGEAGLAGTARRLQVGHTQKHRLIRMKSCTFA